MNTQWTTAPLSELRPVSRGIEWWHVATTARNWLLPCLGSILAAAAVGLPGSWVLGLGATNLVGAVLWLSGLALLASLVEVERRGPAIAVAALAVLVLGLALAGRSAGAECYLAGVWALAAGAALGTLALARPHIR